MKIFVILSEVKRQRNAVEESLTIVRDVSTSLDMTKGRHHVAAA